VDRLVAHADEASLLVPALRAVPTWLVLARPVLDWLVLAWPVIICPS
jgi:hypothetical protein